MSQSEAADAVSRIIARGIKSSEGKIISVYRYNEGPV